MRVALGSDHAGLALKQVLIDYFKDKVLPILILVLLRKSGRLSGYLFSGNPSGLREFEFGILIWHRDRRIMVANRFRRSGPPSVAILYCSLFTEHNNANILTLGSRVVGPGLALEIVEVFHVPPFLGEGTSGDSIRSNCYPTPVRACL